MQPATVLLDRMFGWKAVLQVIVTKEPLARKLVRFFITSDWSRACVLCMCSPPLMFICLLSVFNQFIRVHLIRNSPRGARLRRRPPAS